MRGERRHWSSLRRLLLAAAIAIGVLGLAELPADAQVPASRLAFLAGGRANTGGLGDRYYFGYSFGVEASYLERILNSRLWVGGASSIVASYCLEGNRNDQNVSPELWLLEAGLALRLRYLLGTGSNTFAYAELGPQVLRAADTVPPDDKRAYVGGMAGGGLEIVISRHFLITLGARYGLFTGPSGLSVLVSLGIGG